MFIFDGVNKTITIDDNSVVNGAAAFTPEELWTAYVNWAVQADNLKFTKALDVIGGNPIGSGQAVGTYVFMRNDLGWIGMPPVFDNVSIFINGSLYGSDSTLPIMGQVPGQTTNLIVNRSSLVTSVEVASVVPVLNESDIHTALDSYGNKADYKTTQADLTTIKNKIDSVPTAVWGVTI